jgi:hypothetical protein
MARRRRHTQNDYLRLAGVTLSFVLLLYSLSVDSPLSLSQSGFSMLGNAAVGMSAGVAPNPDNTLAAQFAQKEKELDARAGTIDAQSGGTVSGTRMMAFASLCVSMLVLAMVSANFYMDWRRGRAFA